MNSFAKLPQENDTSWLTDEYDNKSPSAKNSSVSIGDDVIATTWKDGPYLLIVKIVSSKPASNWSLNGGIHFFFSSSIYVFILIYYPQLHCKQLPHCVTCAENLNDLLLFSSVMCI